MDPRQSHPTGQVPLVHMPRSPPVLKAKRLYNLSPQSPDIHVTSSATPLPPPDTLHKIRPTPLGPTIYTTTPPPPHINHKHGGG